MGIGNWIGGVIGWAMLGPIGGLLGFFLGGLFSKSSRKFIESASEQGGNSGGGSTSRGAGRFAGQRNSFLLSLLVLATAVIKADGKYLKSELDYVKEFIRRSFGEQAVPDAMDILKGLRDKQINIYEVGGQIAQYMNYSQRMQLFHFLVSLAQSDGAVCSDELKVLREIAAAISLTSADTNSILAMFEESIESAYEVLEIDKNATDEEVKKAYKKMAIRHHPDKVASLGADVQKAAEEKFKKIQAAYETIKKERNMV